MTDKPKEASKYPSEQAASVRATCLYVATKLGDLMDDVVVVGGLVPSLLIDQSALPDGAEVHAGTMDLDLGLALALFDQGRYRTLAERLRNAGFAPDRNDQGHVTRQRWKISAPRTVTIDFLIPPSRPEDKGGRLRDLESDFAALIAPGLKLAFRDRAWIHLAGRTILGEQAERKVQVCGPGAFVVLKALAFDGRGENKDAYDLHYVIRNYGSGPADVAARLRPLLDDPDAKKAVEILLRDFRDGDAVGARRVAAFIGDGEGVALRQDVGGDVRSLLSATLPS